MTYPRTAWYPLIAFSLSLTSCGVADQGDPTAAERVARDLSYLASDEMAGRLPGTDGFDKAAMHVAEQFSQMGLSPLPGLSGFCQPVRLAQTELKPNTSTFAIGSTSFSANDGELLIQPPLRQSSETLRGEAVFVGYGLEASDYTINPLTEHSLEGKIAVYLNGFPTEMTGVTGAHLSSMKPALALELGAAGTVEIETPQSLQRRPWSLIRNHFTKPLGTWISEDGIGEIGLPRSTVRTTGSVTEALFAKSETSLDEIMAALDNQEGATSFPLKIELTIDRQAETRSFESCNAIGFIPGTDDQLQDEVVLFMAHLDHLGETEGQVFNGAFDNAIGVSILLEVARQLAHEAETSGLKRSVAFVALTAEESGLLGADYLAQSEALDRIGETVAAFNVDMPVLTFPFEDVILHGADESTLGPVAIEAAQDVGIAVSKDNDPANAYFVRSDHYSFVMRGVPAIYTKLGKKGGGAAAKAEFLKRHYHQPSDDLNIPVDWSAVERFTALQLEMTSRAANMSERPQWRDGSVFARRSSANQRKGQHQE